MPDLSSDGRSQGGHLCDERGGRHGVLRRLPEGELWFAGFILSGTRVTYLRIFYKPVPVSITQYYRPLTPYPSPHHVILCTGCKTLDHTGMPGWTVFLVLTPIPYPPNYLPHQAHPWNVPHVDSRAIHLQCGTMPLKCGRMPAQCGCMPPQRGGKPLQCGRGPKHFLRNYPKHFTRRTRQIYHDLDHLDPSLPL